MKYFAKKLPSIYEILKTLPKPLALLDFMCGTLGGEVTVTQGVGGQFYDKWHQDARVVALCWEGASILYSNISDDQIEFTDRRQSRRGDKVGKGWKRKYWLAGRGHREKITAIPGIIAHGGPYDVSAKGMKKWHGLDMVTQWKMIKERLVRTDHVFSTGEPPLVQEPYIAIFDRNEQIQPERNTHMWQINLFRQWAQDLGFKLVVISDFYPRRHQGVIHIPFADRNLDRLCNIIRHSVLYAAPASGSGSVGMVFGCNFVHLCMAWWDVWPTITRNVMPGVVKGRGFQDFGVLDDPSSEVARKVGEYLVRKRDEIFCQRPSNSL
jgi:hypothetical protein